MSETSIMRKYAHEYAVGLVLHARERGGFTLNVREGKMVEQGSGGYCLSVGHCEMRVNACFNSHQIADLLMAYAEVNHAALMVPGMHLGCWIDGGNVYFDVSQRVDNEEVACKLCEERCELAWFDVDGQVSVTVEEYRKDWTRRLS